MKLLAAFCTGYMWGAHYPLWVCLVSLACVLVLFREATS